MRRGMLAVLGIGLVLTLWLTGCEKSITGPDFAAIQDAVQTLIAADPLFTSDGDILNDNGASMGMEPSPFSKTATPIFPRGWGRKITQTTRNVTFEQLSDTVVVATVTHTLTGYILIRARYSLQSTIDTVISKPLSETTTRRVKFYRVARLNDEKYNWRPREVSAVKGGTAGSQITINQMTLFVGNDTLTVTDPSTYFLKLGHFGGREVLILPPSFTQQFKVRIELTSSDPDTDMVALHRPYFFMGLSPRPLSSRMQLVSQTQNGSVYTRTYEQSWTGVILGRLHFFVSAVTRSSIYDDQATFSSQIWGLPFIVQL